MAKKKRGGATNSDAKRPRAATANKREGDVCVNAKTGNARSRGGEGGDDCDANRAATKSRLGDACVDNEWRHAESAAGETKRGSDEGTASRKHKSEKGEPCPESERHSAPRSHTRRTKELATPNVSMSGQAAGGDGTHENGRVFATCRELQSLQRRRVEVLTTRIMIDNRLAATVATSLGYYAGLEEKDRKAFRQEAETLIAAIMDGAENLNGHAAVAAQVSGLVIATMTARTAYQKQLSQYERQMLALVKTLPVFPWAKGVRGFGPLNLAIIIGETGDLSLYANPAKVWKRLGLAPYNGRMPSTWKSKGGLSSEEWSKLGYSPRRRSVTYLASECILKQNKGKYRKVYDESKAKKLALNDDKWPPGRCHKHGLLLAVKELVLDLWCEWNGKARVVEVKA